MTGRLLVVMSCTLMLAVMVIGCCEQFESREMPAELQLAIDSFYRSVETGNVEARIALFADSAMILPNHWTPYLGKTAIADMLRSAEGWVFKLRNRQMVDFKISGDLACTVNFYEYAWYAEGGEPQWHKTKNVHIWTRDSARNWKLYVDLWNSDVPIAQFAEE